MQNNPLVLQQALLSMQRKWVMHSAKELFWLQYKLSSVSSICGITLTTTQINLSFNRKMEYINEIYFV